MTTTLRLTRPALAGPSAGRVDVELDAAQGAVIERVVAAQDRALLVLGAPGSGKTTLALEAVVAAVAAGVPLAEVLVLVPTRRGAAELRDRLAARLRTTSGAPVVRTPAAAAFAVLRRRAVLRGEPVPTLVSGAEQDLILADLLAGHAAGEGASIDWPADVRDDVLGMRAFRDELRDLLMRATERGLAPVDLARLGQEHGRPEWIAGARLLEEYLDVVALRAGTPDAGERLDPAVVVDEASRALQAWEDEVPREPRPRWRLVVVDDHQESTAATASLLRVLADDGARLLLLADPDEAVQTFRGATPALVGRAAATGAGPGELGAQVLALDAVWRHGGAMREVVDRIAARIGSVGAVRQRQAAPRGPDGDVRVALLRSEAEEAAYVAHTLRRARLERGVAWDRMAVIARTGAQVTALRRALSSASVPVEIVGSDVALRDEPAVAPLLLAMRVVLGALPLDGVVAARLACSPLGRLDAVALRRVRRALRAVELDAGGGRTSDALLVEALTGPVSDAPAALGPLGAVLAAGRSAAALVDGDAQTVLWALWDASGLAELWRRAALAGGAAGDRADRDLDAVLALFRAAETFVDRTPRAAPTAFTDWLAAQDLPSDSLAPRARRAAVPVLTPAGAAGREWDVVVVAGVQDGTWPDLRLRDSLLGAQALVDVLSDRSVSPDGQGWALARTAVLHDELRSFAVACSRARGTLLVTAVVDTDHEASPFIDLVRPSRAEPDDRITVAPAPLDLRGLVATLRRELEAAAVRDEDPDPDALGTLALLAEQGVPGADPSEWYGLAAPSSDEPLWRPGERVPVSPSKVESAQRCALRWALESAGGTPAGSRQQSLGTLVHAIAQAHPRGTRAELEAALDESWAELGLGDGWSARALRRRADAMVARLAGYLANAGEPLLLEGSFRLETERAVVAGQVDRIEDLGGGRVRVVDLKTGSSAPSAAKAQENAQLGAYQLAVDADAFAELHGVSSGGAQLVYLGGSAKSATIRDQVALERAADPAWARVLIDEVAASMAARSFAATANELCDRCPVRRSCPLRDEGGQVTA